MAKRTKTKTPDTADKGDGQVMEHEGSHWYLPAARRVVTSAEFRAAVCEAVNTAFHELLGEAAEDEIPPDVPWYDTFSPNLACHVAVIALEGTIAVLEQELKDLRDEGRAIEKGAVDSWRSERPAARHAS